MQSKQNGALEFTVRPEYSLVFTLREGMELMFTKYFKSLKIAPPPPPPTHTHTLSYLIFDSPSF